ncbi:MAG: hypothetical protein KDJ25_11545 [Rhodoblastus sp.]|nr:hypothetical protein [Rhodoblastus sp.]
MTAFEKRGDGQHLGRRDHALAASPMDANLEHSTVPRLLIDYDCRHCWTVAIQFAIQLVHADPDAGNRIEPPKLRDDLFSTQSVPRHRISPSGRMLLNPLAQETQISFDHLLSLPSERSVSFDLAILRWDALQATSRSWRILFLGRLG